MRSKADFRISANQKLIQSKESIGYERIFVGQKPTADDVSISIVTVWYVADSSTHTEISFPFALEQVT